MTLHVNNYRVSALAVFGLVFGLPLMFSQPKRSAEKVKTVLFLLECRSGDAERHGGALAFDIGDDVEKTTFFVTANHILSGFNEGECRIRSRENNSEAVVASWNKSRTDTSLDLAVISAKLSRQTEELARSGFRVLSRGHVSPGANVLLLGHPASGRFYLEPKAEPVVAVRGDTIRFHHAGPSEGYSGGALLTEEGLLCGMITGGLSADMVEARSIEAIWTRLLSWDFNPRWQGEIAYRSGPPLNPSVGAFFELGESLESVDLSPDDQMDQVTRLIDVRKRIVELEKEKNKRLKAARFEKVETKKTAVERIADFKVAEKRLIESILQNKDSEFANVDPGQYIRIMIAATTAFDAIPNMNPPFGPSSIESISLLLGISVAETRSSLGLAAEASEDTTIDSAQIRKIVLTHGTPNQREAFAAGAVFQNYVTVVETACVLRPLVDILSQLEVKGLKLDSELEKALAGLTRYARSKDYESARYPLVSLLSQLGLTNWSTKLPRINCITGFLAADRDAIATIRGLVQAAIEKRSLAQ